MLSLYDWQQTFQMLHDKTWKQYSYWRNEPSSVSQVRGLNILLCDGLLDKSRECKLHAVSKIIGREIESTNDLSKIEVHTLITILKDEKTSTDKEWELSNDGSSLLELAELDFIEVTYAPA